MPTEKSTKPILDATVTYAPAGPSGNAFWIMGATASALRKAGRADLVNEYIAKATGDSYENLLAVTREYVNLVEEE